LLLVHQFDTATWSTIGGAVEIGESPAQAAIREVREEIGLDVELTSVRAALGGPAYDVVYANGDRCSYVSVVYDARTVGGTLAADGQETTAVRWVAVDELPNLDATSYATSLFRELGLL
jgi:ADP-ribose pyrophosphatase YjhB (NUDIX family)